MATNYKERLISHIEALDVSYENIIQMLNEEIEVDEDTGKVKLKDAQRKLYAEGILKSSETAEALLRQIKIKQAELDEINEVKKIKIEEEKEKGLSSRLK